MAASDADRVFEEFQRLRDAGNGSTQERFERYCTDVLTSVERIHFDYKAKQDRQARELGESDKRNLAEAISGFANSGGGVILWGVNQKDDSPPQLEPIAHIQTFVNSLMQLAVHATDPPVSGIDGCCLPSKSDPSAGFAAILVPESPLPPHRVTLKIKESQHKYYVRSGSSFVVATHTQLEDMFGRRPRPKLVARVRGEFPYDDFRDNWLICFDVINEGRGTAKSVCVEFPSREGVQMTTQPTNWRYLSGTHAPGTGQPTHLFDPIDQRVLHPGMTILFDGAMSWRRPHFTSGQHVTLTCTLYCEGCAPVEALLEGTLQVVR